MADITMCKEEACPLKMQCFRYRATPDLYWQAYYVKGELPAGEECRVKWLFETEDELKKLDRSWK
jgi:hypothetical protein